MRSNSKVLGTKVTEKMYKLIQEHAISLHIDECQIIRSIIWEIINTYNVKLLNISTDGPYIKKELRYTLGSRVSLDVYTQFSKIARSLKISPSTLLRVGIFQYLNNQSPNDTRFTKKRHNDLYKIGIPTEFWKVDPLFHFFTSKCSENLKNQQSSFWVMQFQNNAINNLKMCFKVSQIAAAVVLLLSCKPNQ